MRVVLDTNVLIDGLADDFNAQAKLIDAVIDGELTALSTPALEREYRTIMRRLIDNDENQQRITDFINATTRVPEERVEVQLDDLEDRKFLKAAVGGEADALVTRDHHLLDVGEINKVRILTPVEAWAAFEEENGSDEWSQWATGLGIGGLS